MRADLEDLALTMPCPYCRTEATYWCTTVTSGDLATRLHASRVWPFQQAFSLGYKDAMVDAKAYPEWAQRW